MPLFDFLGPKTVEDLTSELDAAGELSSSMAAVAMAAFCKRESRLAKGLTAPNLFVLGFDAFIPEKYSLIRFIKRLQKVVSSLPDGLRFQLLISTGTHWFVMDLYINGGTVTSFILDGFIVLDSIALNEIMIEEFPTGKHFIFAQSTSVRAGRSKVDKLQYGDSGCRIFALQHAAQLSLMSADVLYTMLEVCSTMNDEGGREISIQSLKDHPEEAKAFAAFLMTMQSLSLLVTLPKEIRETKVGKHKLELSTYISRQCAPSQGKLTSKVVPNKLLKAGKKVFDRLLEIPEEQFKAIAYFSRGEFLLANPRLLLMLNQHTTQRLLLMRLSLAVSFLEKGEAVELQELIDRAEATLSLNLIYQCLYQALTITSGLTGLKRFIMAEALGLAIAENVGDKLSNVDKAYFLSFVNMLNKVNSVEKLSIILELTDETARNNLKKRMQCVLRFLLEFGGADSTVYLSSLRLLSLVGEGDAPISCLLKYAICLQRILTAIDELDGPLSSIWQAFLVDEIMPTSLPIRFTVVHSASLADVIDRLIAIITPVNASLSAVLFSQVEETKHQTMLQFLHALKYAAVDSIDMREVLAQQLYSYYLSVEDQPRLIEQLSELLIQVADEVAASEVAPAATV